MSLNLRSLKFLSQKVPSLPRKHRGSTRQDTRGGRCALCDWGAGARAPGPADPRPPGVGSVVARVGPCTRASRPRRKKHLHRLALGLGLRRAPQQHVSPTAAAHGAFRARASGCARRAGTGTCRRPLPAGGTRGALVCRSACQCCSSRPRPRTRLLLARRGGGIACARSRPGRRQACQLQLARHRDLLRHRAARRHRHGTTPLAHPRSGRAPRHP